MLRQLSIQNYAIIDSLVIDFSKKLNIITGETGAGKSILMGALNLILGERADSNVLVNKEKKCVVEGYFTIRSDNEAAIYLKTNDLDDSDELVIRREIAVSGKSRAFVNDTPVTVSQLQELTSLLVDLHQQFDTLSIGESDFQQQVLDALAGTNDVLREYKTVYKEWQQAEKKKNELLSQKLAFNKEADYHQFQFDELNDASFNENELEEMDQELKLLSNAEEIKSVMTKVQYKLEESDDPVTQQLKTLSQQLQVYSSFHPDLPALIARLQSTVIEIKDIADEINSLSEHINYDPRKIDKFNDRLSIGYKLLKKHGVSTTNELIAIKNSLELRLQAVLNMDDEIKLIENKARELFTKASSEAATISDLRKKQVKILEEKVNKLLKQVGMPNARLKVAITSQQLGNSGADAIDFLFNANAPSIETNKSGNFQPVRKVASGGELSRLMLCIKSLVAQNIDLPTMIFDEIDTGISGEAAKQVGIILKDLAEERQVICITHQPQIAGKANAHFFVYKEIQKDKVKTNIRQLSNDERITAIAKMLSGEKPTAAAMENAREMVNN